MNTADRKKFTALFNKIGGTEDLEVLQEIDVGYNSMVYLVSADRKEFAVKVYDRRFNGIKVGEREKRLIERAGQYIPEAVPKVALVSAHMENEFGREVLVMEKAEGEFLAQSNFGPEVFDRLTSVLVSLHKGGLKELASVNQAERIENCRRVMTRFLAVSELIPRARLDKHLDNLSAYIHAKKELFRTRETLVHGDIWWDNILVSDSRIMIIDWLEAGEHDYGRDLAQFKLGALDEILDKDQSQSYFQRLLDLYREELHDDDIYDRMRFFLPLMCLEEAFYLPFDYFPWELKYDQDPDYFEERFKEYFAQSESSFDQPIRGR
jgi:aminoglycoside phosphotransferase (APT) family kinase protein